MSTPDSIWHSYWWQMKSITTQGSALLAARSDRRMTDIGSESVEVVNWWLIKWWIRIE